GLATPGPQFSSVVVSIHRQIGSGGDRMAYSPDRFDALVAEFRARSEDIMTAKRGEYSPDADRLQNFREVAAFLGQRPSQVAMTYLLKHVQSLNEAVRNGRYAWCWQREDGG